MQRRGRKRLADVLRMALQCAIEERETLIEAYNGDEQQQAVRDAQDWVRAFKYLHAKLFKKAPRSDGRYRTVTITQLQKMVEDGEIMLDQDGTYDPTEPTRTNRAPLLGE